jgi:hypothetical protein
MPADSDEWLSLSEFMKLCTILEQAAIRFLS